MDSFKFDVPLLSLVVTSLLTGLSAGLCFIWTNTITPGLGKLDDPSYLQAFQHLNRVILNPLFFLVFLGPVFLIPISLYLFRDTSSLVIGLLIGASALYIIGLGLVTVFGNVPLNEILDKTPLESYGLAEAKQLRDMFEGKWNSLHLIRTLSSTASFFLLLLSCLLANNTLNT